MGTRPTARVRVNRAADASVYTVVLRSPARLRRALLLCLVAGVLVASGCGSSSDEKSSASQGKAKSTMTPKPANGY